MAVIHNWCCSNCTKPRCCRTDGCTILSLVKVLHSGIPGKRENPQVGLERVFPASILLTILFQHNYVPEVLKDLWYLHQSSFAHWGQIYIEFLVFKRLSSLLLEMGSCGCYRLLQVSWRTTKGIIYDKSTLTPVGIFLLWYSPIKNPIFLLLIKTCDLQYVQQAGRLVQRDSPVMLICVFQWKKHDFMSLIHTNNSYVPFH